MANVMPAMHVARMARRFATTVTIYTHGAQELTQALEKASDGTGIRVDSRPIARLVKGQGKSDVEVAFEDGTQRMEGFLVMIHHTRPLKCQQVKGKLIAYRFTSQRRKSMVHSRSN